MVGTLNLASRSEQVCGQLLFGQRASLYRLDKGFDSLVADGVRDADHRGIGHLFVGGQHTLDLKTAHIFAAALDHIAPTIDKIEPSTLIEITAISGMEPTVCVKEFCGGLFVLIITGYHRAAPFAQHTDLAQGAGRNFFAVAIDDLDLVREGNAPHRGPVFVPDQRRTGHSAHRLGHAVAVEQFDMEPRFKTLLFLITQPHREIDLFETVILFPRLNRLQHHGAVHDRHRVGKVCPITADLTPEPTCAVMLYHNEGWNRYR